MSLHWLDRSARNLPQRREELRSPNPRRSEIPEAISAASNPRLRWSSELENATPRSLPLEISFLAGFGVPAALLRYAASLARRQGVSADAALLPKDLSKRKAFIGRLRHISKWTFSREHFRSFRRRMLLSPQIRDMSGSPRIPRESNGSSHRPAPLFTISSALREVKIPALYSLSQRGVDFSRR